jgi:hypothetical protein
LLEAPNHDGRATSMKNCCSSSGRIKKTLDVGRSLREGLVGGSRS